jgi:hypothetical protein
LTEVFHIAIGDEVKFRTLLGAFAIFPIELSAFVPCNTTTSICLSGRAIAHLGTYVVRALRLAGIFLILANPRSVRMTNV